MQASVECPFGYSSRQPGNWITEIVIIVARVSERVAVAVRESRGVIAVGMRVVGVGIVFDVFGDFLGRDDA